MKKLGFEFIEVMSGSYTRTGAPEQTGAIRFQGRARAADTLRHLRDGLTALDGTLDMEGFADDVPISGTIEIRPLLGKIIRYDFSFTGNDGNSYRFSGQKDILFSEIVRTMTTLVGNVTTANGDEVARATLHFDVKADLLPFLVSWKAALGG
jgi:hypothetical protein